MATGPSPRPEQNLPVQAKKVVCVSWVPQLAHTRELLLRQAGFEVISLLGVGDLSRLDCNADADLLILSHSVPRQEKLNALTIFKRNCSAPVLSLLAPHQAKLPEADYAVEAFSPAEFLDAVKRFTSARRNRWKAGCKNCDLVFKFDADLTAFPAGGTLALQCPHCRHTHDYQRSELTRDDDSTGS
ncbi:MAG TPA: hypothetical protein VG498_13210 [Terriglobales bacterium]|nr:hypothetical protein [Terriglobales bacterium]